MKKFVLILLLVIPFLSFPEDLKDNYIENIIKREELLQEKEQILIEKEELLNKYALSLIENSENKEQSNGNSQIVAGATGFIIGTIITIIICSLITNIK